eukprot:359872-Chlamydomonas_euryale.AAC.5
MTSRARCVDMRGLEEHRARRLPSLSPWRKPLANGALPPASKPALHPPYAVSARTSPPVANPLSSLRVRTKALRRVQAGAASMAGGSGNANRRHVSNGAH